MPLAKRIVLFDIDLTLVDADFAGREALTAAFHEVYGVPDAFAGLQFQGRTDTGILQKAIKSAGVGDGAGEVPLDRFVDVYADHLDRALVPGRGRVLPGVRELLTAVASTDSVRLGLATGNFRRSAMMKLSHYDLDGFFDEGGFGDDDPDRAAMVRVAAERLARPGEVEDPGTGVVVVGDTPLDVAAAHANGFAAAAVATGFNSADELRASGSELVFEDLSDTERVRQALLDAAAL